MITNDTESLRFGSLDFLGHRHRTTEPYWFEALGTGSGSDFGNPVPIEQALASFLQDGSISVTESNDNREMPITVVVRGINAEALSQGEMALVAEIGRRNVLSWAPPDAGGAGDLCVFDVVNSSLAKTTDDFAEKRRKRKYSITIKALPFARSSLRTPASNPAPPSTTPVVSTIDACTATTGWARTPSTGGTGPTTSGGAVLASWANPTTVDNPNAFLTLTRTGLSVSFAGGGYVRIDWSQSGDARLSAQIGTVKLNGTAVDPVARNGTVFWYPFTGTLNSVALTTTCSVTRYGKLGLSIADISKSDIPKDLTGARQRSFSLPVAGSVRTQGSFSVEDPATALGSVLLYTTEDNNSIQPNMRQFHTVTAGDVSDPTLVSGYYSDLSTQHIYRIPLSGLTPGGYVLVARVKHASAATYPIVWWARTGIGAGVPVVDNAVVGNQGVTGQSGSQSVALAANTWTLTTVGRMTLPTVDAGPGGVAYIYLSGPAGLLLDESWLFNVETGQLVWVDNLTLNRLFIDEPSLDTPVQRLTVGTAADKSDAYNPGMLTRAADQLRLVPPSTNVFVVTTNAVAASVNLSYYARFHTHVVDP